MSRKHYRAVAQAVYDSVQEAGGSAYMLQSILVSKLSGVFKEDNDNFDSDKFRKACYGKKGDSNEVE